MFLNKIYIGPYRPKFPDSVPIQNGFKVEDTYFVLIVFQSSFRIRN
jgi:hypothetical protein